MKHVPIAIACLVGCSTPSEHPKLVGPMPPDAGTAEDAPTPDGPMPSGTIRIKAGSDTLTDFDFGNVKVGTDSVTLALTVSNDTTEVTGVLAVTLAGASPEFQVEAATDCDDGLVLAPGATCNVRLCFVPDALGAFAGELDVGASPGGMAAVQLAGTGVSGPKLSLSPPFRDFGTVEFGHPASQTFTVTNTGPDVTISAVDATNGIGAGFTAANSTCSGALTHAASCTFDVVFDPAAFGQDGGDIVIATDLGSVSQGLNTIMGYGAGRITVTKDGTGSGTVSSDGGGNPNIDCGPTCSGLFVNAAHVLAATPNATSVFVGWSDASCGASPTCNVTAGTTPVAITATFEVMP